MGAPPRHSAYSALPPRARVLLPLFALALVGLSARTLLCTPPPNEPLYGATMGTQWSLTLGAPALSSGERAALRAQVQQTLDAVDAAMSTWNPSSELSRLNAHESAEPFALSEHTFFVLRAAQDVAARSGGAFDVTLRPLVSAWGFGADARMPEHAPAQDELEHLRARVGHELLVLDARERSVRKLRPALRVDLSAIAKGFGVDRVAETLLAAGRRNFLMEVGGEVRAHGERPGGGAWRVAIERPEPGARALHAVLELQDRALATSGDYRNFVEAEGARRSHLIDPRSGRPAAHAHASVSVAHRSAMWADAWATALFVLGPEHAPQRARAEGLAAYGIVREPDGGARVWVTPGFPRVTRAAHAD